MNQSLINATGVMDTIRDSGGAPFPIYTATPGADLTLAQKQTLRVTSAQMALARAQEKRIVNAQGSEPNAVVRQILPFADLITIGAATALSGAVGNNQWRTAALAAGVVDTYVNSQLAVNKLLVIYGVSFAETVISISTVTLARGAAGGGGINGLYSIEYGYDKLETEWYFSKPVLWDPQDIIFIQLLPTAAVAGGQRVVLLGYVVEPVGVTVAAVPR